MADAQEKDLQTQIVLMQNEIDSLQYTLKARTRDWDAERAKLVTLLGKAHIKISDLQQECRTLEYRIELTS